jgi:hypothetical protein
MQIAETQGGVLQNEGECGEHMEILGEPGDYSECIGK